MTQGCSANATGKALSRRQNVTISLALAVVSILGGGGWVKTRRFLPFGALAVIAAATAAGVLQALERRVPPSSVLGGTAADLSDALTVATSETEPARQPKDDELLRKSWPQVVADERDEDQGVAKNQAEVAALKAR